MTKAIDTPGASKQKGAGATIDKLRLSMSYALGVYIFLNPFAATSPQEILFYTAALIFIILAFSSGRQLSFRTPLAGPFALFAGWVLISLFFALDKAASLNDAFFHLLKLYLLYYMLINFFNSGKRLESLSWLVIVSTTIFILAVTLHWYVILGNPLVKRLGHTYRDYGNVTTGFYTLFALGLALRQLQYEKMAYRKGFLWVSIALMTATSILSQARSTVLALVALVGIFYMRKKKLLACITLLLLIFIMATPLKNRFTRWNQYYLRVGQYFYFAEIIKDYPVFGVGYSVDTFREGDYIDRAHYMARIPEQLQNPEHPYYWPHNMFFSLAVRAGLPAAVLFSLFFIIPGVSGWKLARNGPTEEIKSWGVCGLACLGMFFVKGNLDQAFLSGTETIFFTILAIITDACLLESCSTRAIPAGEQAAAIGQKGAL